MVVDVTVCEFVISFVQLILGKVAEKEKTVAKANQVLNNILQVCQCVSHIS
jgi:hypothetical protein